MKEIGSSYQLVADIIRIHEDRSDAYKQILRHPDQIALDLRSIFERIVEESMAYKQQLEEAMIAESNQPGEIYMSWKKMRVPLFEADKKVSLAIVANDELLTINTYSLAISQLTEVSMVQLLSKQLQELKNLHSHISRYESAQ